MNRRHFLKSISIIPLLIAEKNTTAQNAPDHKPAIRLHTSAITGLHLFDADKVWSQLQQGDTLTLTRETRDTDQHAISVNWNGYRLGYIPDSNKRSLAFLMDKGHKLRAKVSQLQQNDDPWEKIEIDIYREEPVHPSLTTKHPGEQQRLAA